MTGLIKFKLNCFLSSFLSALPLSKICYTFSICSLAFRCSSPTKCSFASVFIHYEIDSFLSNSTFQHALFDTVESASTVTSTEYAPFL